MSKERARARAQREALAAARVEHIERDRAQQAARRRRRDRRALAWRRVRLWQHGAGSNRNKERWAALLTALLVLLVLTFLFTGSLGAVLLVVLVVLIGAPALGALFFDRRSS